MTEPLGPNVVDTAPPVSESAVGAPVRRRVYELSTDELAEWCVQHGAEPFRAKQIRKWIFGKRIRTFDEMHDIPARIRAALNDEFSLMPATILRHQVASDRTEKLLLQLGDAEQIECVLMREPERRTVCISTQVGCGMGCVFCASGMLGLKRNLTAGEILEQVLQLDRLLELGERITNVVVMGIGEPLANIKNLLFALDSLSAPGGMGLGARRITISTVGLPDRIRELADVPHQYNLAISLHAPNNALRDRLVGINSKIGMDAVLQAADDYFAVTGRRVTFEYVLLSGLNDGPAEARELAQLLAPRIAHVNLIPLNDVQGLPYVAATAPRTQEFLQILTHAGIPATVRKRKGADIDAACGQLRLQAQPLTSLAPAERPLA